MQTPVVIMGVSGSGKSTVGFRLAGKLRVLYIDGDALHPAQNKRKMAAGVPLTDEDRAPWLDAIGAVLAQGPVVVACSALRRSYRDRLRTFAPALRLIYLYGSPALLAERVAGRSHAFMPPKLLDSQLATLEAPGADERAFAVDVALPPAQIVARAVDWLHG
jgi:carbohydrate kinase (thermoresistant glucokinase family)